MDVDRNHLILTWLTMTLLSITLLMALTSLFLFSFPSFQEFLNLFYEMSPEVHATLGSTGWMDDARRACKQTFEWKIRSLNYEKL